jgi:vacuolar protein sorting-associated protein 45
MLHLKVIYFIRPTEENFNHFKKELKDPRFNEYYLFFSNSIPNLEIERLAELDENDLIKSI